MQWSLNKGFTLLELLVVMTILALTTTLVGLNLHGRERTDLESLARTLVTDLRYVRSRAMIGNIDSEIRFDLAAHSYTSDQAQIERFIPESVTIKLTVDQRDIRGSSGRIVFYPDGSSSGGKIELSHRGQEKEITTTWLNGYVALR